MSAVQYVLLSMMFLFIYSFYLLDNRIERYVFVGGYGLNSAVLLAYGVRTGLIALCVLMLVMGTVWYIGFKRGWGDVDG